MARAGDLLRYGGAAAMLVVGAVHFQQYVDFISEVPTIGVLFLLNAAGSAAVVAALLLPAPPIRVLAALGGIGICVGALVSIAIAMGGGLFDYQEPELRTPVAITIVAEAVAVVVLGGYLLAARRREPRAN